MVDDPIALLEVTSIDILTRGHKWSWVASTMSLFKINPYDSLIAIKDLDDIDDVMHLDYIT